MKNGKQAKGKQEKIEEQPFFLRKGLGRRTGFIHAGKRNDKFPVGAEQYAGGCQDERKERKRQDGFEKGAGGQTEAGIQIEVLRIPDGSRHASEVGGDGLHHDDKDEIFLLTGQLKDEYRERNKCDERDIVRDEHGDKKGQQDERQE